ncbi:MAG: hypothetical protein QS748_14295 [Candidatus Endonucleobacter bathymodioli]|uniref:Uncharacterized protein n=1 Tax=Candidatus Endonucleibacter bathymodioli TaxID=539814 RepID=A0AA90P190_9GAMM|nr:hypothetical protein [Candidatus Endonucleobacter bathymodioli]
MSTQLQKSLARLLLAYSDKAEYNLVMEMLVSAQKGLTEGANDFADKAAYSAQAEGIKSYLRCYPLAHILIGITSFNELNKDTSIIRKIIDLLLDNLEIEPRTAGNTNLFKVH